MRAFRRLYGDSPRHLLVLLGCFAVSAYAASRLRGDPAALRIALWFVGAAVAFDLLLSPLLALADRLLTGLRGRRPARSRAVSPVNFVRVPVLFSGLLLLIYAPDIFQRSEPPYFAASGLDQDPYLERWLGVTAVIFLGAGLAYVVAVVRQRGRSG